MPQTLWVRWYLLVVYSPLVFEPSLGFNGPGSEEFEFSSALLGGRA